MHGVLLVVDWFGIFVWTEVFWVDPAFRSVWIFWSQRTI